MSNKPHKEKVKRKSQPTVQFAQLQHITADIVLSVGTNDNFSSAGLYYPVTLSGRIIEPGRTSSRLVVTLANTSNGLLSSLIGREIVLGNHQIKGN